MKLIPQHNVHTYWANRMVGRSCPRTHRLMDSYAQTKGGTHRDWFHTPLSAATVASIAEGDQCVPAALNHLLIDKMYSNPDLKIVLEMMRLSQKEAPEPQTGFWTGVQRCKVNRHS